MKLAPGLSSHWDEAEVWALRQAHKPIPAIFACIGTKQSVGVVTTSSKKQEGALSILRSSFFAKTLVKFIKGFAFCFFVF